MIHKYSTSSRESFNSKWKTNNSLAKECEVLRYAFVPKLAHLGNHFQPIYMAHLDMPILPKLAEIALQDLFYRVIGVPFPFLPKKDQ